MLDGARFVGFVPITDVGRARSFYESTLGLRVVEETQFALVVDAGGTTLRLTLVDDHRPQPFTIAGWDVDDIASAVSRLAAAGIEFKRYDGMQQDESGVWHSPSGARVAWFLDPDGNTLSLSTFST